MDGSSVYFAGCPIVQSCLSSIGTRCPAFLNQFRNGLGEFPVLFRVDRGEPMTILGDKGVSRGFVLDGEGHFATLRMGRSLASSSAASSAACSAAFFCSTRTRAKVLLMSVSAERR